MTTEQIVILTVLGVAAFITFLSLVRRMALLEDRLWIELGILTVIGLFMYLVASV